MVCRTTLSRSSALTKTRFVLRSFGLENIRESMRRGIELGEEFTSLLKCDKSLFEIITGPQLGVIAFRIKASSLSGNSESSHEESDRLTLRVCQDVNASGRAYLTGCTLGEYYILRMVTTHVSNSSDSIRSILELITQAAKRAKLDSSCNLHGSN